jgi:pimeloyl-ACP methyl ester carboxylesterase
MSVYHYGDAEIFYETQGSGPALLLICGGPGVSAVFEGLADQLTGEWTVITYDLPGHARSRGPRDRDVTMGTEADIAAGLLAHLGHDTAVVFGSSAGAVIGVDLLARHPAQVRALVVHEPPMVELLPDAPVWRQFIEEIIDTSTRGDTEGAFARFTAEIHGGGGPGAGFRPPSVTPWSGGVVERAFSLQHVVPQVVGYQPDIARLTGNGVPVAVLIGAESGSRYYARAAEEFAGRLGIASVRVPGAHLGFLMRPVEFAAALSAVLSDLLP